MRISSVILGQHSLLTAEAARRSKTSPLPGGSEAGFGNLGKPLSVHVADPLAGVSASDSAGSTPQGKVTALLDKIRRTLADAGESAETLSYSRQAGSTALPFSV